MKDRAALLVAVVDDDDDLRDATATFIRSLGYGVEAFASGQAFLDWHRLADTCCLITDFSMPGMDGLELLERVKADQRRFPVIMVTGSSIEVVRPRALKAGAYNVLNKPYRAGVLADCINSSVTSFLRTSW